MCRDGGLDATQHEPRGRTTAAGETVAELNSSLRHHAAAECGHRQLVAGRLGSWWQQRY